MDALKEWTIPIAILTAWLAASGYTVARLSWATEAWQARAAAAPPPAAKDMAESVRSSSAVRLATHHLSGYGQP
jgi:hypothetical protein